MRSSARPALSRTECGPSGAHRSGNRANAGAASVPAAAKSIRLICSEYTRSSQLPCELGNDMSRTILPGSILKNILLVMSMLELGSLGAPVALGQRVVVHSPGESHIAPPMSHPPISRPPVLAAPPMRPAPPVRAWQPYIVHSGPYPIRPRPPIFPVFGFPFFPGAPWWSFGPAWGFNSYWWTTCHEYLWPVGYTALSFYQFVPGTSYVVPQYEYPVYPADSYGDEVPQLFLKDGSVYDVTDYWVVNGQLHFTMLEEGGTKPVEHVIGFDELDLQKTVDTNTARGFRFVLRNQPIEKYLREPSSPSTVEK